MARAVGTPPPGHNNDDDHDNYNDSDSDDDLLHAPDVVPDLLQELLLVTLLAGVLHIAQEHPGLVNLDIKAGKKVQT